MTINQLYFCKLLSCNKVLCYRFPSSKAAKNGKAFKKHHVWVSVDIKSLASGSKILARK